MDSAVPSPAEAAALYADLMGPPRDPEPISDQPPVRDLDEKGEVQEQDPNPAPVEAEKERKEESPKKSPGQFCIR
jgi:hypothetical protein